MTGLTTKQANELQMQYGKNELKTEKKQSVLSKILHALSEPMFLLLIAAAVIYFILGEPGDGAVMLVFVVGIIGIEIFQELKTDRTLDALKDLSAPHTKVIRDGAETEIASVDLVPGDVMLICEGAKIPADGKVLKCSDLCVDESTLTGEAEGVWKNTDDICYAGTLVVQGMAYISAEKTGMNTEYGKIGANVAAAKEEKTPLQRQTGALVKLCAGIAAVLFALVSVFTYFNIPEQLLKNRIISSVLSGITLSMAMLPEEFPVILTVFLSMGAWRLAKNNSLVRKLTCVETLGAVSVLCVDKTGTITMNQMTVRDVWAVEGNTAELIETMGLACETDAYDPMEKAMLTYCEQYGIPKTHLFGGTLISEYAFTNELKMMGHIWHHDDEIIIAAKGSPEQLLTLCNPAPLAEEKMLQMSKAGLRVIAVAIAKLADEKALPEKITDCRLTLCGLVGLADPPRESVKNDIALCAGAGVRVVMITGDNGVTAASIAEQVGIISGSSSDSHIITGDMLENMSDDELCEKIKTVSIFSRVIPEHKMRIVKAFKDNGEIVAMTGDGVNDAPALKHADIGIAMGKRGSEVSREAADLILMDDNFSTIVDTIRDGRRIYENIRRAVNYVFAIHIPIACASLFGPVLGITPSALMLLPLHVVLLELIIDPTCSIVLEQCPASPDAMEKPPRNPKESLVTLKTLTLSILRGLFIFAASFGAYYYLLVQNPDSAPSARAMGLVIIMVSSLFLVAVEFRKINKLTIIISAAVLGIVAAILYSPLNVFLKLAPLSGLQLLTAVALAAASVLIFEPVRMLRAK